MTPRQLTSLEFKSGVNGHIFVSWLHPYKEQKLIVVGSKAMAVFDDVSKEKLFIYPHKIDWKEGKIPVAQKADYQVIPIEAIAKVPFCHPELVSGSHNLLILLDAEINSA